MKPIRLTIIITAALATMVVTAFADSMPTYYPVEKGKHIYDAATRPGAILFQSQELSLDVGTTYTTPADTTILQPGGSKGKWGMDLGADYWIKRYVGLGLSTGIADTRTANVLIFSHVDIRGSLREPFDLLDPGNSFLKHFALVESAAFGRDLEDGANETTLAAMFDFRLTPVIGFESGYRRIFENGPRNDQAPWVIDFQIAF